MAYINMGHGVQVTTAVTGLLFAIAAIIYVDDTDLLHWARTAGMTDEEFFAQVQQATIDWGKLAIASGGSLKPEKCFWYLIAFKFVHGQPQYKSLTELPQRQLHIPTTDGRLVPIQQLATSEATKTLGVVQCPEGDPTAHLAKMKKAGLDWADRASTTPLHRVLSRQSHDLMLVPQMRYGIECLLASPAKLSTEMRTVMFRCLPHLGVNRNMQREFCTLSREYQGLQLVDWPIEKLSADLLVMLQHWDSTDIVGLCLREAYELLQMETGLDGNIFTHNFAKFGCLATHSWMKILWEYLAYLDITFELSDRYEVPVLRANDFSIMKRLSDLGWSAGRLVAVNRVRKFKQVSRLSCVATCDGR
jgi:hypothetical protein